MREARVVVTGGAGFIGHHLVRALEDQGDQVLVIDDLSGGIPDRLRPGTPVERLDIASGDIAHPIVAWRPAIVYHLAAQLSVPRSMQDPDRDLAVNVTRPRRVLEAAKAAGVSRFIFVSSGGAIMTIPREDDLKRGLRRSARARPARGGTTQRDRVSPGGSGRSSRKPIVAMTHGETRR